MPIPHGFGVSPLLYLFLAFQHFKHGVLCFMINDTRIKSIPPAESIWSKFYLSAGSAMPACPNIARQY